MPLGVFGHMRESTAWNWLACQPADLALTGRQIWMNLFHRFFDCFSRIQDVSNQARQVWPKDLRFSFWNQQKDDLLHSMKCGWSLRLLTMAFYTRVSGILISILSIFTTPDSIINLVLQTSPPRWSPQNWLYVMLCKGTVPKRKGNDPISRRHFSRV